jgi:hypothetical protein
MQTEFKLFVAGLLLAAASGGRANPPAILNLSPVDAANFVASSNPVAFQVNNFISGNAGADTGFIAQNSVALAPLADPDTLRPIVTVVSPFAGQSVSNSSPATYAIIANRDTTVDASSVNLTINGIAVPSTTSADSGGVEITWSISELPPAATFTNTITYADSDGVNQSFSWTYSYPFLSADNCLPVGSLSANGFQTRTVMSLNGGSNLDNSLARALEQLAVPPQIPVDFTRTTIVSELNWNLNGNPNNIPGLCAGSQINIAVQSMAYLHLTAGAHRLGVNTADRAGFYSGATPWDTNGTVLFEAPSNSVCQTFDFVVGAEGLYPILSIWESTSGGAFLTLSAVDPDGINADAVVGDPSEPPGAIDVYYPLVCFYAPSITGPFMPDPIVLESAMNLATSPVTGDCGTTVNQAVSGGTGTFTIPFFGDAFFFRVAAPVPSTIVSVKKEGWNIVLSYQLE